MILRHRLENITTVDSLDEQLRLAKQYYMALKGKIKNDSLTLAQKVELNTKAKAAEKTLHQLRKLYFDIEDALVNQQAATTVLTQSS